jgi:hypothetical protein
VHQRPATGRAAVRALSLLLVLVAWLAVAGTTAEARR